MAQLSKTKLKSELEKRAQLRWQCIRLNQTYREAYDKLRPIYKKDGFGPDIKGSLAKLQSECVMRWNMRVLLPYEEKDLKEAFRKRFPMFRPKEIVVAYEIMNIERTGKLRNVSVTLPESLKNPEDFVGQVEFLAKATKTSVQKQFELHTSNDPVRIEFNLTASRRDVHFEVEGVFERLRKLKKLLKLSNPNPQAGLLEDHLDMYEKHKYEGKSLRELAKEGQGPTETYAAAYIRIKGQLKTATRYVEGEACKDV